MHDDNNFIVVSAQDFEIFLCHYPRQINRLYDPLYEVCFCDDLDKIVIAKMVVTPDEKVHYISRSAAEDSKQHWQELRDARVAVAGKRMSIDEQFRRPDEKIASFLDALIQKVSSEHKLARELGGPALTRLAMKGEKLPEIAAFVLSLIRGDTRRFNIAELSRFCRSDYVDACRVLDLYYIDRDLDNVLSTIQIDRLIHVADDPSDAIHDFFGEHHEFQTPIN